MQIRQALSAIILGCGLLVGCGSSIPQPTEDDLTKILELVFVQVEQQNVARYGQSVGSGMHTFERLDLVQCEGQSETVFTCELYVESTEMGRSKRERVTLDVSWNADKEAWLPLGVR